VPDAPQVPGHGFLSTIARWISEAGVTRVVDILCVFGVVVSLVYLGVALAVGSPQLGRSAVMSFLACLSLLFVWKLISELHGGDRLSVESHWGGFGNGLGGWRLSASLVYLVGAISFGIIFAVSSMIYIDKMPTSSDASGEPAASATAAPAQAQSLPVVGAAPTSPDAGVAAQSKQ
jgi:hypothetical protein